MTIQLKKELLLHGAAHHDAMMLDQVVRAQKATGQHVHQGAMMLAHHDATMLDQVDHVQVVRAPKVTDQHAHHDAMMLVHHDATMLDQVDHVRVVHAPKVTDQHAHHDATMHAHHDETIDQVASGRVGLVLQAIALHAEVQKVHAAIPISLRAPKQPKNANL